MIVHLPIFMNLLHWVLFSIIRFRQRKLLRRRQTTAQKVRSPLMRPKILDLHLCAASVAGALYGFPKSCKILLGMRKFHLIWSTTLIPFSSSSAGCERRLAPQMREKFKNIIVESGEGFGSNRGKGMHNVTRQRRCAAGEGARTDSAPGPAPAPGAPCARAHRRSGPGVRNGAGPDPCAPQGTAVG